MSKNIGKDFPKIGKLFVVGTPIGNLGDVSKRMSETLSTVDYILAENTTHTLQLLRSISIEKSLEKYPHNEQESFQKHIDNLLNGKNIAIVSDAGLPCLSDPGCGFIRQAIQNKIQICVIPGPNAAVSAIIGSGFLSKEFCFLGFIPQKGKISYFQEISFLPFPIIFYETSHRLNDSVSTMLKVFGNRKLVIAREITKKFEEYIYTDLQNYATAPFLVKGEITLVIEGKSKNQSEKNSDNSQITMNFQDAIKKFCDLPTKSAVDIIRKLFPAYSKNEIYTKLIKYKN